MAAIPQVIIHDVGQVICGVSVTLHDHLVVHRVIVKNDFAVDQILELSFAFWDQHPNDVWFATLDTLVYLFLRDAIAESVVFGLLVL
jgi:hypothetical protein